MAFDGIVGRRVSQQLFQRPISHFFAWPLGVTLVTITPEQLCIVKEEIETHKLFIVWILQNTCYKVLRKTFQTFPFQSPARPPTATISLSVSPLEWGAHPLSLRPPIQVT